MERKKLFAGIDIGKLTLVVALSMNRGLQYGRRAEFANSPAGFNGMVSHVEAQRDGTKQVYAVSEATGVYGLAMVDYLLDNTDWQVCVINPFQIKRFRDTKLVRTKTDAVDAFNLAQYGLIYEPKPFIRPDPVIKELEVVLAAINAIMTILGQEERQYSTYQLRPIQNARMMALKEKRIRQARADLESLLKQSIRLATSNRTWKKHIELLCSIPGIGERTAICLLPTLLTLSPELPDCRKLVAYAGLDPVEKQSGISVRGRVRMSKRGNKWLRRALYMATLTAVRFNPVIKTLYDRNLAAGQPPKKAVVSCMPRLLRLVWGVYRNQRPFEVKLWGGLKDCEKRNNDFAQGVGE